MAKTNPDADRIVQFIQSRRHDDQFALAPRQIADATGVSVDSVTAILKTKPCKDRLVVVADARKSPALVALADDAARLAGSDQLLQHLVAALCGADKPIIEESKLVAAVSKPLKDELKKSLKNRRDEGRWPEGVAAVTPAGKKPSLHATAYPLPLSEEVVAAIDLVKVLRAQRESGGDPFARLGRLFAIARPLGDSKLLKPVIARPEFQEQITTIAAPKTPQEHLVVLRGDEGRALESAGLTLLLIEAARKDENHLIEIETAAKPLQAAFRSAWLESIRRQIAARSLPAGIGFLRAVKKSSPGVLFLMKDVVAGQTPGAPSVLRPAPSMSAPAPPTSAAATHAPTQSSPPAANGSSFAERFDAAFRRIEARASMPNWVSLVDLRREMPGNREEFDRELYTLRRNGLYTLSAAEGRNGVTMEEREAGIVEDGALQLFVSRRRT